MKKIISVLTIASALFLVGCKEKENNEIKDEVKTVVDRVEREVIIPENIQSIVVTSPSNVGILIELGLLDKIVGADSNSIKQYDELGENVTSVGGLNKPGEETVTNLMPDLLITGSDKVKTSEKELYDKFTSFGITVLSMPNAKTLKGITEDIELFGKVFDKEEKAGEMITEFNTELDKIRAIAQTITTQERIYYEVGYYSSGIWTTGRNTFQDEIISVIGATNVFSGFASGWTSISEEVIINAPIQHIVTSGAHGSSVGAIDKIKARAAWQNMDAIKNNNIYVLNENYINQPTHKTILGIKDLARAIYPEAYANI